MTDTHHLRVLYVDDDRDIRHIVKLSLALDGAMELRTCAGGEEALEMLASDPWRPDVVMLDVMMPKMDGPALMAQMRKDATLAATPVLFVTARAREADIRSYHEAGAKSVILKPFDPISLARTVRSIIAEG